MLTLALSIDSFILTKSFELSEAEAKALTTFPRMTSTLPLQRVNQRKAQFCSPKLFLGLVEEEKRPWKKQRGSAMLQMVAEKIRILRSHHRFTLALRRLKTQSQLSVVQFVEVTDLWFLISSSFCSGWAGQSKKSCLSMVNHPLPHKN